MSKEEELLEVLRFVKVRAQDIIDIHPLRAEDLTCGRAMDVMTLTRATATAIRSKASEVIANATPTKSRHDGEMSVLPAIRDKAKEIMDTSPGGTMSLEQIRALPDDDLWLLVERSLYNARWIYAQAVGVVGVIANLPAETIQSLEVGTKAAERPKCPGCGAIVAPPYVCADCRDAGSQPFGRFKGLHP